MSNIFCNILECIKQKDYEKAHGILWSIEKESTLSWHRAYLTGFCLMKMGDIPESIIYYKKSLAIFPQQPITLNALGISYHKLGNLTKAYCCFEHSIKILDKPYFPEDSSYNLRNLILLSEALNSMGVLQQHVSQRENLLTEAFDSIGVPYQSISQISQLDKNLMELSLINHMRALNIECDVLNLISHKKKEPLSTFGCQNDLQLINKIDKSCRYRSANLTIYLINVSAQMFRMNKKYLAIDYLTFSKNQIDVYHPQWFRLNNLLRDMVDK